MKKYHLHPDKIFNGILAVACVISIVTWGAYYIFYLAGFYETENNPAEKNLPSVSATTSPLEGNYDSSEVVASSSGNVLQLIKYVRQRTVEECSENGQIDCAATAVRPAGQNHGNPSFMPTTSDIAILAGYYDGATIAGDEDFVPGSIKAGVEIFGVTGTAPSPIYADCTEDGQITCSVRTPRVAGQLRDSLTASDGQITVEIPAGYYDGTKNISIHDSDLVAANIKAGVTLMGVTGTWAPSDCTGTPWGTIAHGAA